LSLADIVLTRALAWGFPLSPPAYRPRGRGVARRLRTGVRTRGGRPRRAEFFTPRPRAERVSPRIPVLPAHESAFSA